MTNRQRLTLAPYWFFLAILTVELGACTKPESQATVANIDFWTCAMHPAVHLRKPGKCPICGMDLIPVEYRKGESSVEELKTTEFTVPIERQQQMGVTCSEARIRPVRFDLRSVGTLEADKAQHLRDTLPRFVLCDTTHPQPITNVLGDREVRKERVLLKNHAGVPVVSRHGSSVAATEQDVAGIRAHKTGDHA